MLFIWILYLFISCTGSSLLRGLSPSSCVQASYCGGFSCGPQALGRLGFSRRRKWQPTPVFLPGESQGRQSLVGCRLWGRTIGHDWSDLAAAAVVVHRPSCSTACGILPDQGLNPCFSALAAIYIYFYHRTTKEVLIWTLKIFFSHLRLLPFFCAVVDFFLMSSSSWYTMDMNVSGLPSHFLYETEMNWTEIFVIDQKFSNFFKLTTF